MKQTFKLSHLRYDRSSYSPRPDMTACRAVPSVLCSTFCTMTSHSSPSSSLALISSATAVSQGAEAASSPAFSP